MKFIEGNISLLNEAQVKINAAGESGIAQVRAKYACL